jgi:uncharacterized protein HemY
MALAGRTAALMTLLVTTQFTPGNATACPPRAARPAYYPRPVYVPAATVQTPPPAPALAELVAQARLAFRARSFARVVQLVDQVLARQPQNSELLQMKSLALMFQGNFQAAAVAAHTGLSTGVILDRATLVAVSPSEADYVRQLELLEAQALEAPDNPDLQFLLAYHRLAAGKFAEGRTALEAARSKLPDDKVIPVLLSQLPQQPNVATAPAPPVE